MRWFALLFVLAAGLAFAAPAFAEKADSHDKPAAAKADGHGGGEHGEKKGGLAFLQLERYDLGIFTLIVFGLLVIILGKTAWPKITAGLEKREANIQAVKDEALAARQEAEKIRLQLQKDHADSQDKIRAMLEEARRDADTLRAEQREAGVKDAATERERARREIESAKDAALNDIYKQAVNLAALMSAKTMSRKITADDHHQMLDESLAELKKATAKS